MFYVFFYFFFCCCCFLGREHGLPIGKLTHEVVTLWYRPPEILLGQEKYSGACDMWGVGCIIAEMATRHALFCGDCEIDQIFQIFQILGTPNENIWPGVSNLPDYKLSFPQWKPKTLNNILRNRFDQHGIKLLKQLLTYAPNRRITAKAALNSPWFDEIREQVKQQIAPLHDKQQLLFRQLNQNYKQSFTRTNFSGNNNTYTNGSSDTSSGNIGYSNDNQENINKQNVDPSFGRNLRNNSNHNNNTNNNQNKSKELSNYNSNGQYDNSDNIKTNCNNNSNCTNSNSNSMNTINSGMEIE